MLGRIALAVALPLSVNATKSESFNFEQSSLLGDPGPPQTSAASESRLEPVPNPPTNNKETGGPRLYIHFYGENQRPIAEMLQSRLSGIDVDGRSLVIPQVVVTGDRAASAGNTELRCHRGKCDQTKSLTSLVASILCIPSIKIKDLDTTYQDNAKYKDGYQLWIGVAPIMLPARDKNHVMIGPFSGSVPLPNDGSIDVARSIVGNIEKCATQNRGQQNYPRRRIAAFVFIGGQYDKNRSDALLDNEVQKSIDYINKNNKLLDDKSAIYKIVADELGDFVNREAEVDLILDESHSANCIGACVFYTFKFEIST